jgi:hypothetical protein
MKIRAKDFSPLQQRTEKQKQGQARCLSVDVAAPQYTQKTKYKWARQAAPIRWRKQITKGHGMPRAYGA